MLNLCHLIKEATQVDLACTPGSGAAGGIAGGFHAILGAKLRKGAAIISDALSLEKAIQECDVVITGEGSFDAQSMHGKVVVQCSLTYSLSF